MLYVAVYDIPHIIKNEYDEYDEYDDYYKDTSNKRSASFDEFQFYDPETSSGVFSPATASPKYSFSYG